MELNRNNNLFLNLSFFILSKKSFCEKNRKEKTFFNNSFSFFIIKINKLIYKVKRTNNNKIKTSLKKLPRTTCTAPSKLICWIKLILKLFWILFFHFFFNVI